MVKRDAAHLHSEHADVHQEVESAFGVWAFGVPRVPDQPDGPFPFAPTELPWLNLVPLDYSIRRFLSAALRWLSRPLGRRLRSSEMTTRMKNCSRKKRALWAMTEMWEGVLADEKTLCQLTPRGVALVVERDPGTSNLSLKVGPAVTGVGEIPDYMVATFFLALDWMVLLLFLGMNNVMPGCLSLQANFSDYSNFSWGLSLAYHSIDLEDARVADKAEFSTLHGRLARVEQKGATVESDVAKLAKDVEELKKKQIGSPLPAGPGTGSDRPSAGVSGPAAAIGDELSEEDKRTLIVGGWAQDSKRQVIIDECAGFLNKAGVTKLLDQTAITVWGPRRSFGVLKFVVRDGETAKETRDRMWGVIQAARAEPYYLDSTSAFGEKKKLWCSFTKTREARCRGAHGSMVRRVCHGMVADAALANEAHNVMAKNEGSYEVDWGSGTVWIGEWKLGSATHRMPKGEDIRQPNSGWIDIGSISRATGVAFDVALAAFERELDRLPRGAPGPDARPSMRVLRKFVSWNVAGQNLSKIDLVAGSFDLLAVQEMPRGKVGWDEHSTDNFVWFSHQGADQWRGVGIGVARELFDSVTNKTSCERGAAWVVRLKSHKRLILCSLHCPTGGTVAAYHREITAFKQMLRRWHPDLPVLAGVDVNEVVRWNSEDSEEATIASGAKVDKTLEAMATLHLRAVPPRLDDRALPTHYPRDEMREGRHIDAVFTRRIGVSSVTLRPEMHLEINSDHALLEAHVEIQKCRPCKWYDSRPRWVVGAEPLPEVTDFGHVEKLAVERCRACSKCTYQDDDEMKGLIAGAGVAEKKDKWKIVHKERRRQRISNILYGDWGAYRAHRATLRRTAWWGELLTNKESGQVAGEVEDHLSQKFWDVARNWDVDLRQRLDGIDLRDATLWPVEEMEVIAALTGMRARSSVGCDKVSVDLLRRIALEQPSALCQMCTDVLRDGCLPPNWGVSLLALLPKCLHPQQPGDLRPIAMGSAAMKMMSRIVMNRTFGHLRSPSCCASSGKGRQPADLIGTFTRLRDITKEWRIGVVAAKLDVRGAFDFIDRGCVASFLQDRLGDSGMPFELRFLLLLLAENVMVGTAPGGKTVRVDANRGIKQGSPESAELFGLIIAHELQKLRLGPLWTVPGGKLADVPVDVGCFQDDIFVWNSDINNLEKNIQDTSQMLARLGFSLSPNKTRIIANRHYKGRRQMTVDGTKVEIAEHDSSIRVLGVDFDFDAKTKQQSRKVMGRIWDAFHANKDILCGHGSWGAKTKMVRSLLEGTWAWTAGALHWAKDDLMMINSIQLRVYRLAFGVRRGSAENWVDYNTRSLRTIRAWMQAQRVERWSSKVLRLQFALVGHWCRRKEGDHECMPALMMGWRDLKWWRAEQKIKSGMRHPERFYADNSERALAEAIGLEWKKATSKREGWKNLLPRWLESQDVRWTRGRQPALSGR
ncbi:unnamed protein product [Symbiodinium sp. CCMP2592]|nr:unnamed protein product [Symbiodinium sp. CCMP2592]